MPVTNEIVSLRTLGSRTIQVLGHQHKLESFTAPIHYDNRFGIGDGQLGLRGIDQTWIWSDDAQAWGFVYDNFRPTIPKYADQISTLRDVFGDKNQSVGIQSPVTHVQGQLLASCLPLTSGQAILYSDCYGTGIDLIVYMAGANLRHVWRIRVRPAGDLQLPFQIELNSLYDPIHDLSGSGSFVGERVDLIAGAQELPTVILPPIAWDSSLTGNPIVLSVSHSNVGGGKVEFVKTIPAGWLSDAVGDVFADATLTYTPNTTDGYVENLSGTINNLAHWQTARNALTGTSVNTTFTTSGANSSWAPAATYQLRRMNYPFDTSGLPDTAIITGATLDLKLQGRSVTDTQCSHDVALVDGAATGAVVTADYDAFGAIRFADLDLADPSVLESVYTFLLNQNGLDAIQKTGTTKLGLRTVADLDGASGPYPNGTIIHNFNTANGSPANRPLLTVNYFVRRPLAQVFVGSPVF